MGQLFSGPGGCLIKNEDGVYKCVPCNKYKPLPASERHLPGQLMLECRYSQSYSSLYHWTNCQFLPNDDTKIIMTAAAYDMGRSVHPFVKVANYPHGKIHQYDIEHLRTGKIKCEAVSRTSSTTLPKVQVHPDSCYICFLDSTEVKIFHRTQNTGIHSKAYEAGFRRYRSFAISPDGKRSCILAREGRTVYELLIYGVNVNMYCDAKIPCTKLDKDFVGTGQELVDCKWSPNSRYVAITMSTGCLLCVNVKGQNILCNVFEDILSESYLSNVLAYDFDPSSGYQIMAVGDSQGYLCIINVEDKKVIAKSEKFENSKIDCLVYTAEADFVGIAMHDFKIHLCEPISCNIVMTIDMLEDCPYLHNSLNLPYPMVTSMSFSRSGEQLAVCCYDQFIRVYQMPVNINLKMMCKFKVLSLVEQGNIQHLPLPSALKNFLLPLPLFS